MMDESIKNRIDMIVAMLTVLTGLREDTVLKLVKGTAAYRDIINGEEEILSEDYSANVIDIAQELKEAKCDAEGIDAVTPSSVCDLSLWMLVNGIENADQLKDEMPSQETIEREIRGGGIAIDEIRKRRRLK